MTRPPFRIVRTIRNTDEATDVVREIRRQFPLVDVDESDVPSMIAYFKLVLDADGRPTPGVTHDR